VLGNFCRSLAGADYCAEVERGSTVTRRAERAQFVRAVVQASDAADVDHAASVARR